jgi:hypothetical protein
MQYCKDTGLVESDFIKVYYNNRKLLNELSGQEIKLLISMFKFVNYKGIVEYDQKLVDEVMGDLGIKQVTIRCMITKLVKKNVLRRIKPGVYMVNPDLIFKGKVYERSKAIMEYYGYRSEAEGYWKEKEMEEERERQREREREERQDEEEEQEAGLKGWY